MPEITFAIIPHGSPEYKKAVSLREDILRKPLNLAYSEEELMKEKDYVHVVGLLNNEVVATSVLVPQGEDFRLRSVTVKEGIQTAGIGSRMMTFCEEVARAEGGQSIWCHARDTAVNFYKKNKYVPEGDYFEEHTIPHLKMYKIL